MEKAVEAHQTVIRVRYGECDQGGVVYHANYLNYLEVGRTEFLRSLGTDYASIERGGVFLAVVESRLFYRSPAVYDDEIAVLTQVVSCRKAGFSVETRILRLPDERLLAEGFIKLAALNSNGQVVGLPRDLRATLQAL